MPREIVAVLHRRLNAAAVPAQARPFYWKWVRFYLDFCHKYGHSPRSTASLAPFLAKLASKNQSPEQQQQAAHAVNLLLQAEADRGGPVAPPLPKPAPPVAPTPMAPRPAAPLGLRPRPAAAAVRDQGSPPLPPRQQQVPQAPSGAHQNVPPAFVPASATGLGGGNQVPCAQTPVPGRGASWEREYAALEATIKMRNHSPKTLEAYRFWIRKFQGFVRSRPPELLGGDDVKGFLSDLAVRQGVAASTQNQAFNALLFFYRHVLGREFGKLDGVVRAKRRPYIPVVLSRGEVEAVLGHLEGSYRLVGLLLYGCGLRLAECLGLRVHCFNLESKLLTVHDGKGQKDRTVPLPERALADIRAQMENVRRRHGQDLAAGYAGVFLPRQLERKYRNAAREFIWQWFFPAANLTLVPGTGEQRRYHLHDAHVQHAVKQAAARAGIPKRVSPHTFRHTFASHLLLAGYDLQTIQKLLGHGDVKTTMIYLQTVPSVTLKEAKSPLDLAPPLPSGPGGAA